MLNLKIGHLKLGLVPYPHYAIHFDGVNVTLLALRFGHFSLWSVWAILNVFSAGGANIWVPPSSAMHFLFHDEENLNTIKRKLENQRGGYLNLKKRLFAKQIYKDKRSFAERDVRPDPSFRGHSGILGTP